MDIRERGKGGKGMGRKKGKEISDSLRGRKEKILFEGRDQRSWRKGGEA